MPEKAQAADKPSKGSTGWEGAWVRRDVGEEGSAEAFTKATPDQRACLEQATKCRLSHHFFLTPDGEITCSVILIHSKSLDINMWVVTQLSPFNAAQLRHKDFIFFSVRLEEERLERRGSDTAMIHHHVGCGFGTIRGPCMCPGRLIALHAKP